MKKIKKIGVFDSGVGGLSVLKSLINEISFEKIIYYGDTARVPYGNKDKDTIVRFCLEALEFFNHFKLDLLVVACNTASAYALKAMRECSAIPIIGVIESGVKALSRHNLSFDSEILVIATEATTKSRVYDIALRNLGYTNITNIATNLFVSLVEENIFKGEVIDSVFNHYFGEIYGVCSNVCVGSENASFVSKNICHGDKNLSFDGENISGGDKNVSFMDKNASVGDKNLSFGDINVYRAIKKPKAVILGCTHFPLLLESLREYFGSETIFIHSGEAIANYMCENFDVDSKVLDSNNVKDSMESVESNSQDSKNSIDSKVFIESKLGDSKESADFIESKSLDSINSILKSNFSKDSKDSKDLSTQVLDSIESNPKDSKNSSTHLLDSIESKNLENITKVEFFASDNAAKLRHTAKLWLQNTNYKDVE
nr:glutamate racemase [Helicobacter saguini]